MKCEKRNAVWAVLTPKRSKAAVDIDAAHEKDVQRALFNKALHVFPAGEMTP
jgi:hypothetical protein